MPRKSLKEVHPELLDGWDYEKNDALGLYPDKVSYGSAKKPWWKCKFCGHEWQAAVFNRVAGYGCPECRKRRISEKKATPKKGNSLGEKFPEIAKEWNQEKNGTLTPFDVSAHSGQIVWWKCEKGHEWQSAVNNRSGRGQGCPLCFAERQTSFPEQAILYFLERDLKTPVLNRYRFPIGKAKYEIDIYVPKLKVGIEYDGSFWHKGREAYDLEKTFALNKKGIKIIRVKESNHDSVDGNIIFYKYDKGKGYKTLSWVIEKIENSLGCNPSQPIDIVDSNIAILNSFKEKRLEGSLASSYPEVAAEWDYDKNDGLSPDQFTPSSNTKVWWTCQNGHSWKASINHRTNGQGCPYCAGRKLWGGFNDLASQRPDLVKEWDSEANEGLLPSQVNIHSTKKKWWICGKCGYKYQATVTQRVNGRGCPKCAGKVVVAGDNDLATLYPEIAKEWNQGKNENIKPSEFLPGSHKKVWWKCSKCQHEWQAMIYSRTGAGKGCPKCAGLILVPGENDLATLYPQLAKEWDYSKNGNLKPCNVRPGRHKSVVEMQRMWI